MKILITVIFFLLILSFQNIKSTTIANNITHDNDSIPAKLLGNFKDDYGIGYSINDTLWTQYPNTKYQIIKWNKAEQYLIARNDIKNPGDAGLYTRIDYMSLKNMKPYTWGFCITVFNAASDSLAEVSAPADREHPKKGCNGFPFSRMKKND